ncbi:MAG: flagellar basal body-associated FliL family protein [Spirochaetes bacterium]|nr:flagellar basal body-associated FliL family protein [Spirochaetota bacterium]
MAKRAADEDEAVKDDDDKPKEEGEEGAAEGEAKPAEKKAPFKLNAGVVGILKYVLLGLLVVILSFTTSWLVSRYKSAGSGAGASHAKDELLVTDPNTGDVVERLPKGGDWNMDSVIINTADEDEQHIVRFQVIVSYDKESKTILGELNDRKSQIHHEVRAIVGAKKFLEINTTRKQQELVREIKARLQMIVNQEGIIEVFLKEFTVH